MVFGLARGFSLGFSGFLSQQTSLWCRCLNRGQHYKLRSFIPLLMFGFHVALEWMERGLSFLLTVVYPLGTIAFLSPAFPLL